MGASHLRGQYKRTQKASLLAHHLESKLHRCQDNQRYSAKCGISWSAGTNMGYLEEKLYSTWCWY